MYDYFHRELLKRCFAMANEIWIQVLQEEERRARTPSFMWLFRSGEDGLPAMILYGYSSARGGGHAREFLKGYSGYLETDGYQGYNGLPNIKRCSCILEIMKRGNRFVSRRKSPFWRSSFRGWSSRNPSETPAWRKQWIKS